MSSDTSFTVQFSLVPASSAFVPIILDAVRELENIPGLFKSTDAVSTELAGRKEPVLAALTQTFVGAVRSGAHIVQPILAAAGLNTKLSVGMLERFTPPRPSGVTAFAQFALLGDAVPSAVEIAGFLAEAGLDGHAKPLVTRVDGDAAVVLAAAFALLEQAATRGAKPVLSLTLVANLPAAEAFA